MKPPCERDCPTRAVGCHAKCELYLEYEDKMERAVFQEGVLSYIKDEKKNIANLMKYARERRVVKKVQSMIGVWL